MRVVRSVTLGSVAELQLILIIICAVPAYFVVNPSAAKAVVYGGAIAWVNVLLLTWRLRWGGRHAGWSADRHYRQALLSFVERMVAVAAFFVAGIKLLGLASMAMLIGFVVGQMAWVAVPLWVKLKSK